MRWLEWPALAVALAAVFMAADWLADVALPAAARKLTRRP